MAKFIFVTGGVVSGLGKGITAASLGRLLKCRGLKVASQKLDPYVNVDPGTMSPLQHGEVFVTDDGTETDLDLGHYERFIDENLNKYSNLTTGKVYWNVLNKERQGAYLGQTVQIIPHITNEIKSYIYNLASSTEADVVITEIGGTTGDIESQPFLEAIRQVGLEQGRENCCYIHVVLVPYISGSDEYKSKPAQHSVKELQGMGVSPDIIILRADGSVGSDIRRKISTFCNVKPECVIENLTMPSLYQCPLMLHTNGLDDVVVQQLHLDVPPADLTEWKQVVSRIATRSKTCTIALVGKYVKLHDAYLSVMESLYHAGFENDSQVEIRWVESEDLTDQAACKEAFADVDGIIVPGGFGDRGVEGKIMAAHYARKHQIPYLGICLGMQLLFDRSFEYGEHPGLGLVGGEVAALREDLDDPTLKVPHMGWNRLEILRDDPLFRYFQSGEHVYYVHSFYARHCAEDTLAVSHYGNVAVTGVVRRGKVYGAQFHPEKSGDAGLRLLKAFGEL